MNKSVIITASVAWLLACPAIHSREPAPIFVFFEFSARSVREKFQPAQQPVVERSISTNLAQRCYAKMPFWKFQAGAPTNFPHLRIFFEQGTELTLSTEWVQAASTSIHLYSQTFSAPGDEERFGLPNAAELPEVIGQRFSERLLKERDPIFTGLRTNCPVGRTVMSISNGEPTCVVLPLVRSNFPELITADFRISCQHSNSLVRLYSQGMGTGSDFHDALGTYQAITLRHNDWEEGPNKVHVTNRLGQLGQLQVKGVYLLAINPDWPEFLP